MNNKTSKTHRYPIMMTFIPTFCNMGITFFGKTCNHFHIYYYLCTIFG